MHPYVIIGSGIAGLVAAETLRKEDPKATIQMISEEPHDFYSRPGLAYYLRGEHIDAHEAQRLGLVQQVVAHDRLMAAADEWCSRVAAMPPHAVAMTKPLLRAVADADWPQALTMEEFAEPICFTTAAFADSVHSMLAKG